MDNFLLGKSNFFNCLKNQNFRKFACKTRYSFVKLSQKLKFFGNLPVEIEFFLPGSTTAQISNQIDAVVAILLLISLWHHRRSCFLSSRIPRLVLSFPMQLLASLSDSDPCLLSRFLSF